MLVRAMLTAPRRFTTGFGTFIARILVAFARGNQNHLGVRAFLPGL